MESVIKNNSSRKYYIICVDDHREVLDTLADQLSSKLPKNYRFELAESGEEALEILEDLFKDNEEIPVIISDQAMPGGMSGDIFFKESASNCTPHPKNHVNGAGGDEKH